MGNLPIKGSLFISGVGRVPELRPRFLKAAGGKGARILTIPGSNDLTQLTLGLDREHRGHRADQQPVHRTRHRAR